MKQNRVLIPDAAAQSILKYAQLLSRRGWVCNTFGNISLKCHDAASDRAFLCTKHRGISLEEMERQHIVATGLDSDDLLAGSIFPSIGHRMHQKIFALRSDVGAVIHLHPDELIAYYAVLHEDGCKFISNDSALVLQAPVKVLSPDVNIELDLEPIAACVRDTNAIIMPQHGITVMGTTLSEAYHRACTLVAETRRLLLARLIGRAVGKPVPYISAAEVTHMYHIGREVVYGN